MNGAQRQWSEVPVHYKQFQQSHGANCPLVAFTGQEKAATKTDLPFSKEIQCAE